MKKKILIFVGLLFILVLMGCTEDLVEPNPPLVTPPTPLKYTVNVVQKTTEGSKITPIGITEVQEGKIFTLSITKEAGFKDLMTINGTAVSIPEDKYTFTVNSDSKVEFSSEKTSMWYLIQHPWIITNYRSKLFSSSEGSPWTLDKDQGTPNFADWEYHYKKDYSLEIFSKGRLIGNNLQYKVEGDSLIYSGMRYKIMKLNEKEMIIRYVSKYYSAPYVRDPSQDVLVEEVFAPK